MKPFRANPVYLSLLLAGLITFSAQAQTAPREYRDWSVSCSNVKACTAISISGLNEMGVGTRPRGVAADTEMGWLWIGIEAGAAAKPKILYSGEYSTDQPTPNTGSLRVIGKNGRVLAGGTFMLIPDPSGASQIQAAEVDRFLALAKTGHAVVYAKAASRPVQSFASLSGFVAALRAVEAVQGRTGTTGAWVDVGRLPRERIPPAPPPPKVIAVGFVKHSTRTSLPKLVSERRTAECDDSDRLDPGGQGVESFSLGKGRTLWAIPCGAGAYNMWSKFYLQTSSTRLEPYRFARPERAELDEDANSLVNVSIEPETGQISAFAKGRGIGDCGSAETYTWDGTTFVLTSLIEMNACSGLMADFWPERIKADVVLPAKGKR